MTVMLFIGIYKTIHSYISNPFNSTHSHTTPQDEEVHIYFNVDLYLHSCVDGKLIL